jgi:hypothetical protein
LQSLAGSTFDSSQLVLTACIGYLAVTEARLLQLREKHRPAVLVVVEERSKGGRVWKGSKGLASKLYSFKHDPGSLVEEKNVSEGDKSLLESHSSNLDDLLSGLSVDPEVDSLPDLQEQVIFLFLPSLHCSAAFLSYESHPPDARSMFEDSQIPSFGAALF